MGWCGTNGSDFRLTFDQYLLSKRQAANKQQRKINPMGTQAIAMTLEQSCSIEDKIEATQQALRDTRRRHSTYQPRKETSMVLGAGVSLAFLETFIRENGISSSMTAQDAVDTHVKPRTKEIGLAGSGNFIQLIHDGKDSSSQPWCGTPSECLS